jgi:hypothetical protein
MATDERPIRMVAGAPWTEQARENMAVLDLTKCPICHARDTLTRQTVQLESRLHVTYECKVCGTLLAWLGDDMWLDADRWSFQKVGRPERANLLYRSMTVAELRKLAGEPLPADVPEVVKQAPRAKAPPVWIDLPPAEGEPLNEAPLAEPLVEPADEVEEPESAAESIVTAAAAGAAAAAQDQTVLVDEEPERLAEPVVAAAAIGAAARVQEEPHAAESEEPVAAPVASAAVEAESPQAVAEVADAALPEPSRAQRRRSRGSPFLVISVGLVLLCLICSAAAMIVYSMMNGFPGTVVQPTGTSASDMIPTETAAPTDTWAPSPTPSPVPTEAAGTVKFQGVTDYVSGTGSHYLVGEVLNQTDDSLRFVEVLATFYDGAGQVTGTGSTFAELGIIEPGSTAPFKLTTLSAPEIARYDLRVDYETTTQTPIRLEIVGHAGAADGTGWYRVTGEVRNPHDFSVKFPEIVATYYNATHDVIRVEADFSDLDVLEPGQSSPFEVVLTDPPADLHHYALQTEGVQQ